MFENLGKKISNYIKKSIISQVEKDIERTFKRILSNVIERYVLTFLRKLIGVYLLIIGILCLIFGLLFLVVDLLGLGFCWAVIIFGLMMMVVGAFVLLIKK